MKFLPGLSGPFVRNLAWPLKNGEIFWPLCRERLALGGRGGSGGAGAELPKALSRSLGRNLGSRTFDSALQAFLLLRSPGGKAIRDPPSLLSLWQARAQAPSVPPPSPTRSFQALLTASRGVWLDLKYSFNEILASQSAATPQPMAEPQSRA